METNKHQIATLLDSLNLEQLSAINKKIWINKFYIFFINLFLSSVALSYSFFEISFDEPFTLFAFTIVTLALSISMKNPVYHFLHKIIKFQKEKEKQIIYNNIYKAVDKTFIFDFMIAVEDAKTHLSGHAKRSYLDITSRIKNSFIAKNKELLIDSLLELNEMYKPAINEIVNLHNERSLFDKEFKDYKENTEETIPAADNQKEMNGNLKNYK